MNEQIDEPTCIRRIGRNMGFGTAQAVKGEDEYEEENNDDQFDSVLLG